MRPRRAGYFLNLIGRCRRALPDACVVFLFLPSFLFQPTYEMQVMRVGESKQYGLNTSARVKQEELYIPPACFTQVFFEPALTEIIHPIYIFCVVKC